MFGNTAGLFGDITSIVNRSAMALRVRTPCRVFVLDASWYLPPFFGTGKIHE